MFRTMLKSKIHRATVTQADLHYVGSVTIDEDLMDAADLLPGEQVAIVDINNGARLVTKALLDAGSTRWAQGGIAAALAPGDSPDDHYADTMTAGAGLCDPAAVRVLVDEGPARVRDLAALGAAFDRDPDGVLELTREGGHLHRRI